MIKPILFNTEEVRATLDGRKTMTRRVVKQCHADKFVLDAMGRLLGSFDGVNSYPTVDDCPYQYGDILYVRETWMPVRYRNPGRAVPDDWKEFGFIYRADGEIANSDGTPMRWRPSIHMPREAARIFLRVTDVRVERLQEITYEQARAEGAAPGGGRMSFKTIWDSAQPLTSNFRWIDNPWVWVIAFERCEKPEEAEHG